MVSRTTRLYMSYVIRLYTWYSDYRRQVDVRTDTLPGAKSNGLTFEGQVLEDPDSGRVSTDGWMTTGATPTPFISSSENWFPLKAMRFTPGTCFICRSWMFRKHGRPGDILCRTRDLRHRLKDYSHFYKLWTTQITIGGKKGMEGQSAYHWTVGKAHWSGHQPINIDLRRRLCRPYCQLLCKEGRALTLRSRTFANGWMRSTWAVEHEPLEKIKKTFEESRFYITFSTNWKIS